MHGSPLECGLPTTRSYEGNTARRSALWPINTGRSSDAHSRRAADVRKERKSTLELISQSVLLLGEGLGAGVTMPVPPDRMTSHPLTPTGIIPVQLVLKRGTNLAAFFFQNRLPCPCLEQMNQKGKMRIRKQLIQE